HARKSYAIEGKKIQMIDIIAVINPAYNHRLYVVIRKIQRIRQLVALILQLKRPLQNNAT
ncbi:18008_t:CDS:1, partial [Gigaspora rosea]